MYIWIFWRGTFKPKQVILFNCESWKSTKSQLGVTLLCCCAWGRTSKMWTWEHLTDNSGNERNDKQAHDSLLTHQTEGESQFIHLLENNISVISCAFFFSPILPSCHLFCVRRTCFSLVVLQNGLLGEGETCCSLMDVQKNTQHKIKRNKWSITDSKSKPESGVQCWTQRGWKQIAKTRLPLT